MNQIGRYRLLQVLGRGGMGTVYLAEDPQGTRVAVKVINPEFSQHEQFRMRFRREAEAAQRVRRFSTAAVLDADLAGDQLYVVTEYVPGPNLEEAVRQSGPLKGSNLDALAVSVATALTAIHGAGVVHRDLKPSNVLLSPIGPRVIDFGIARALDMLGGVTGTGELIGTPRYMAPEVLRGEPVSAACDVFSWGCLMTYAATGRAPFGGEALPAIVYQVLNTEPDLSGVEPGLRELVQAALIKDPQRRPTAQQLLDHLVGRQAQQTAQVNWQQSHTTPYTQAPARKAGRKGMLIGAAAALAVLAGGAVTAWALLTSSAPPNLPRVYGDDFTNASGDWRGTYNTDSDHSYGYTNDGAYGLDAAPYSEEEFAQAPIPFLVGEPTATPMPSDSPTARVPDSVVIGVDATVRSVVGNGEYGLWCRGDGDGTYYEFAVSTTGEARIRKVVKQAGSNLESPVKVEGFKPREKNRLEASCEQAGGSVRLTLWINGKEVQRVEDSGGLAPGHVGMFSRVQKGSESVLKAVYDNFELRGSTAK
ncbi:serine/threonine-protein kinase [Nonomuraea sp. NPDC050663]|uniref:serine/threonine-protein kinase n=1 Tax=Nonomuraea sp. NPDC050663 TaxID=3364370 RepID=UPI0037898C97